MSIPARRPAGSPAGGQFAPTSHAESGLDLEAASAAPAVDDAGVLIVDPGTGRPRNAWEQALAHRLDPEREAWDRVPREQYMEPGDELRRANVYSLASLAATVKQAIPSAKRLHLYLDDSADADDPTAYVGSVTDRNNRLVEVDQDLARRLRYRLARIYWPDVTHRFGAPMLDDTWAREETLARVSEETGELFLELNKTLTVADRRIAAGQEVYPPMPEPVTTSGAAHTEQLAAEWNKQGLWATVETIETFDEKTWTQLSTRFEVRAFPSDQVLSEQLRERNFSEQELCADPDAPLALAFTDYAHPVGEDGSVDRTRLERRQAAVCAP